MTDGFAAKVERNFWNNSLRFFSILLSWLTLCAVLVAGAWVIDQLPAPHRQETLLLYVFGIVFVT